MRFDTIPTLARCDLSVKLHYNNNNGKKQQQQERSSKVKDVSWRLLRKQDADEISDIAAGTRCGRTVGGAATRTCACLAHGFLLKGRDFASCGAGAVERRSAAVEFTAGSRTGPQRSSSRWRNPWLLEE